MQAIVRKALADLRGRPLQAGLVFAVIAAAAATLSLALNVASSAAAPYERLRRESNGADLWVVTYNARADHRLLAGVEGVQAVSGPFPISWTNYAVRNGDRKQQLALIGMSERLPELDHPVVTDGRWLSADGAAEIVLDRGAVKRLHLKVGQKVDLLTPSGPQPFTLVGFAVPTGRAPAPIDDPAFAFVLPQTLQRLEPDAVFGSQPGRGLRSGVKLQQPQDARDFFRRAAPVLGPAEGRTAESVSEDIKESNQFDVIFLNVFSLFGLVAAGLIIANAVAGQVLSQLRDTGILKAIGFTPGQVTLTLLLQNLALSIVAGAVGIVAGLLIAPFFLERSADVLGVTAAPSFNPPLLAITLLATGLLVALFTLVPAWRAGRVSAIDALNAGNSSEPSRPSRLAAMAVRFGMPRVVALGLKDASRRPARTAMTVAALVLAVVTATFSLGIEATFKKTMADPTIIGGPPYQISADRDLTPDTEARRILGDLPEVVSYLALYWTGGSTGNRGFDVRGVEGDLDHPAWALREGRMPRAAGEAAISTKLARDLGLNVGDTANVRFPSPQGGQAATLTIVGRYVDVEGGTMTVKRETLPGDPVPTDYLVRVRDGANRHAVAGALIEQSGGNLDPEVLDDTIAEIRGQFRSVLIGLNAVLLSIAGVNLLSSMLLSIRERSREFAVLKTIGFTPAQVAQAVFAGSVALAVLAVAVGLPLGLVATRVMFDVLASSAGIGTGVGEMPGVVWLLPLVPGAIAVAALGTVIPARRAASVRVAEALRYE